VTLTDATGNTTVATLAEGAEVEILAWQPLGPGGMRYRIQPVGGSVEGWLSAVHLAAPVAPPPPPVAVAPPPPAAARPKPAAPRKAPPPLVVRPAARKGAVKKKTRRA
jgi:hypothetical protein